MDAVANTHNSRTNNLGHHALPAILHQLAQALTQRIHLCTRCARFVESYDGFANLHFLTDKSLKIDTSGFDIGTDRTGRNRLQTERRRMLCDLLSLNQAHLPPAWITSAPAGPGEVTPVFEDALPFLKINLLHRQQGFTALGRMDMERSNGAGR